MKFIAKSKRSFLMAKPKSFLKGIFVDVAKKKHQCQHNKAHAILMGDKRLKLSVNRSNEYFCVKCAIDSIDRDIEKLEAIKSQLSHKDTL